MPSAQEIGLSQQASRLKPHEVVLINDVFWDEIEQILDEIAVTLFFIEQILDEII